MVTQRRQITKGEILKEIEGSIEWITLNERQIALKTSANSIYGLFGVDPDYGGKLTLIPAAESVTSVGRKKIQFCNKYLEDNHGAKIIYNDTDSTFFTLPYIKDYKEGIKVMNKLAKELSELMEKPMGLEAEKLGRMLAIKKKKYLFWVVDTDPMMWKNKIRGGEKVENPNYGKLKDYKEDEYVIMRKGVVLARRDNFKFLRDIYWQILIMIMERQDMKLVLKKLLDSCYDLYHGKIPWTDLIIIRQLGAHYKSDNYFMKVFGEEIKKLGRPHNPGDRIEYLIVKDKTGSSALGMKLRLPETYLERQKTDDGEEIDTVYYLEKLFIKSIEQLWKVGFTEELAKLDAVYKIEDATKTIKTFKEMCKKNGTMVDEICNQFGGDPTKVIDYLEKVLPEHKDKPEIKYLSNKYILARREISTGRNVFNIRITETPIKDIINSVKKGKYDEFKTGIYQQLSVN